MNCHEILKGKGKWKGKDMRERGRTRDSSVDFWKSWTLSESESTNFLKSGTGTSLSDV